MKTINKKELKELILNGITTEELKEYDYSSIADMSCMFEDCYSLTSIPELNTSNVISMSWMFAHCFSLTSIPELNTSNVKYLEHMLVGCNNLEHCFYDSRINYNKVNSIKLKQNHPEYFI